MFTQVAFQSLTFQTDVAGSLRRRGPLCKRDLPNKLELKPFDVNISEKFSLDERVADVPR